MSKEMSFSGPISKSWTSILLSGRKKSLKEGDKIAQLEASWDNIPLTKLAAYTEVCGFSQSSDWPITFPQVLLTPLHMKMVVSPLFPFPAMGLVHVRQSCQLITPIVSPTSLRAKSWIEGLVFRRRGAEIDLVSELYDGDTHLWTSRTTMFSRQPKGHGRSENRGNRSEPGPNKIEEIWELPANLGRQYMKVSGDFNPIHLYAWTAKPFGFKKAIIHGMWSMAHALAKMKQRPTNVSVNFIRPVILPSSPRFVFEMSEEGGSFWLYDTESNKLCMAGSTSDRE
jgi:hypothetical protein